MASGSAWTTGVWTAARWPLAALGLGAGAYAAYAGLTWYRYGHVRRATADEADSLLDRYMPAYDVVDRHCARVEATAAQTLEAARNLELFQRPLVRTIVRARELLLGATPDEEQRPRGLLGETLSLGWGVLAEEPGREIVVGAVTRPWEANVRFRSIPPHEFAGFAEPGYVKIAWTLRADPIGPAASVFRTETRAVATDPEARARFRRYWAFLSPGIKLIRLLALRPVAAAASKRALARRASSGSA